MHRAHPMLLSWCRCPAPCPVGTMVATGIALASGFSGLCVCVSHTVPHCYVASVPVQLLVVVVPHALSHYLPCQCVCVCDHMTDDMTSQARPAETAFQFYLPRPCVIT
eukprot:scpid34434/ scgid22603/ 